MKNAPAPLLDLILHWSAPAQTALWRCRAVFHHVAARNALGTLDETLKWGQPSWRPKRPRTGSTLRADWRPDAPERLTLFVDCKTDLAARMADLYPDLPANDGRRAIALNLNDPLPEQPIAHLAQMTFTYHLNSTAPA